MPLAHGAGSRVTIEDQKKPTLEERFATLESLRASQTVSEQEYQARRQQILNEI